MSLKFKKAAKKVTLNGQKQDRFVPQIIRPNTITLERLAREIATNSTMGVGDVYGVLKELQDKIMNHLQDGSTIDLETLGRIRVCIRAKAEATSDDVSVHSIKSVSCNYLPSKDIKKVLNDVPKEFVSDRE